MYIDALRYALQHKAIATLGDRRYRMFAQGAHTGHLNALDRSSEHCSTTLAQAEEWFAIGYRYIDRWLADDLAEGLSQPGGGGES